MGESKEECVSEIASNNTNTSNIQTTRSTDVGCDAKRTVRLTLHSNFFVESV
jgi:hypothetical protein